MRKAKLIKIGGILTTTIFIFGFIVVGSTSLVASDSNAKPSKTEETSKKQETINEDIPQESEEVVYEEPVTDTVYTTASLNARKEPSVNSTRLGVLPKNAEITRVEDNEGWDAIEVAGVKCYVNDNYLTKTKPETIEKVTELTVPKTTVKKAAVGATSYQTGQNGNYAGKFKLTAYCACSECCDKWASGYTASGTYATQGRTIATGGQFPFGTKLVINGNVYTVEDRGVGNGVIDIFFNSHQEALNFGVKYADVYYAD